MIRSLAWSDWVFWVAAAVSCAMALEVNTTAMGASENDASGGWTAGDVGFASKARVPQDAIVKIRVVAMGNSRGVVVTFSGNRDIYRPGKLWSRQELREGAVVTYELPKELANRQLAVRSGAATGNFDRPQRVEAVEGAYKLYFAAGRILEVSVRPSEQKNR
jgi:hypothetical protein